MVKKNPVARMQAVALPIIHCRPIGKYLRHTIRTPRPKGRSLRLRHLLHFAEHFAARGLVKPCLNTSLPNCFQNPDRPDASNIGGILRNIETDTNVALRAQMVDLVRLQFIKKLHQMDRISQITVVKKEPDSVHVWILVQMVNSRSVEGAGPANDSMHLIHFIKQKIREI